MWRLFVGLCNIGTVFCQCAQALNQGFAYTFKLHEPGLLVANNVVKLCNRMFLMCELCFDVNQPFFVCHVHLFERHHDSTVRITIVQSWPFARAALRVSLRPGRNPRAKCH